MPAHSIEFAANEILNGHVWCTDLSSFADSQPDKMRRQINNIVKSFRPICVQPFSIWHSLCAAATYLTHFESEQLPADWPVSMHSLLSPIDAQHFRWKSRPHILNVVLLEMIANFAWKIVNTQVERCMMCYLLAWILTVCANNGCSNNFVL